MRQGESGSGGEEAAVWREADRENFSPSRLAQKEKKEILVAAFTAMCIASMMVYNVAAFLAPFANGWVRRGELSTSDVSLIISIFSVAQITFAPFNSAIKNRLGSKNTILVGIILLSATAFGLGAISWIEDPVAFKWAALCLRFLQGQGDIMVQVTCYSLATSIYPD